MNRKLDFHWVHDHSIYSGEEAFHLWVELGGEKVSELWVLDITVRACGTEFRSAGVADVRTPAEHRLKGYARHLLGSFFHFARDQDFEISTLYGIPQFYQRFGWATVSPKYEINIDLNALNHRVDARPIEKAAPEELDTIARMYNQTYATLAGAVVRPETGWPGPRQGSRWDCKAGAHVLRDSRSRLAGYAVVDAELTEGRLVVTDAVARNSQSYENMLLGIAELARTRNATGLIFMMHPERGLGPLLEQYPNVITAKRPENRGYMARIINQQTVMEKAAPALRERAAEWRGRHPMTLTIRTSAGQDTINLGGSAPPAELQVGDTSLTQMLFGYRSYSHIRNSTRAHISNTSHEAIETIFTDLGGYCFCPDFF